MQGPVGVAQVVHSLEVGGMERVALNIAAGLDRSRFRPLIVCLAIRGEFADVAERQGIEVLALGKRPGVSMRLPFRLARILRERGIRLIHGHNSGPWFTGTLAGRVGGIGPVVITDHSRPYPERFRVRLTEWCLSHLATVVSVSEENRRRLVENLWIDQKRVHVIPNGVAPLSSPGDARLAELRAEFGLRGDETVFLCVARLEAQKGHEVLIDAAALLKARGVRARVLCVGQGTRAAELRERAARAGAEDVVSFTGVRMDVAELYFASDALVLSSHWEGLPMALLESMSAGRPAVATGVGDIPQAITDGSSGLLVPAGDAAALADAMESIARDPERTRAMGAAARARFDEEYSVERMVRRYEALYTELL